MLAFKGFPRKLANYAEGRGYCLRGDVTLPVRHANLLHRELTREIVGAFYEVYNVLGTGYLESVYKRSLVVALEARGISTACEVPFEVYYSGVCVGQFRADLVVDDRVVVESKAVDRLAPTHDAQLLNYLKASGLTVGLLFNFGRQPVFKRLVRTR
jgi:GxxExxY protein